MAPRATALLVPLVAMTIMTLQAGAISITSVSFPGPDGVTLTGVRYEPSNFSTGGNGSFAGMVMMHGCSGMWSRQNISAINRADGSPDLQNNLEKWGRQLAAWNTVAVAVDSFTPRGLTTPAQQDQCGGTSVVDPYTTRVADARAAYDYLVAPGKVNASRVGLLGWSNGAQAVLVEAAERNRTLNTPRPLADHKFAAAVAFYPGCGTALKFGTSLANSFWRPHLAMHLIVGTADGFFSNCSSRATTARSPPYTASLLTFPDLPQAPHSFDAYNQTWPASKCATEPPTGEECAQRAKDPRGRRTSKRLHSSAPSSAFKGHVTLGLDRVDTLYATVDYNHHIARSYLPHSGVRTFDKQC